MLRDALPEGGSLGGIYTALLHSRCGHTLVVACDMPFLSPALLRHMLALREEGEYDVIVPRVDGYPQGLHAVYSQACVAPIRAQIESGRLKSSASMTRCASATSTKPSGARWIPTAAPCTTSTRRRSWPRQYTEKQERDT